MRCPNCAADDDRVVDSRPSADGTTIRRRRECHACAQRFTTFERVEQAPLVVRKRNGSQTTFSRDKVLEGMSRAAKNRVPMESLRDAVFEVEASLRRDHDGGAVTSEQVGLAVLTQLRGLDPVAYVRFASVYKNFQGPEDFESELSELRKDAPPKL